MTWWFASKWLHFRAYGRNLVRLCCSGSGEENLFQQHLLSLQKVLKFRRQGRACDIEVVESNYSAECLTNWSADLSWVVFGKVVESQFHEAPQSNAKPAEFLKFKVLFWNYALIPGTIQNWDALRFERHVWSEFLTANKVCRRQLQKVHCLGLHFTRTKRISGFYVSMLSNK